MAYLKMYDIVERISRLGRIVFTINDAAKLTGKPKAYLSRFLPTSKHISRAERGKYYIIGTDPLEIASNITYPSYISLFSAIRYYDLTTQMTVKTSIVTTNRHKPMLIGDNKVEFRTLGRERLFGYAKSGNIFMASTEKAIVDSLYFGEPPYSYLDEAFKKGIERGMIDTEKLKEYGKRMRSSALINRLGFLLESNGINADSLMKLRSPRHVRLSGFRKHDKRWRIE